MIKYQINWISLKCLLCFCPKSSNWGHLGQKASQNRAPTLIRQKQASALCDATGQALVAVEEFCCSYTNNRCCSGQKAVTFHLAKPNTGSPSIMWFCMMTGEYCFFILWEMWCKQEWLANQSISRRVKKLLALWLIATLVNLLSWP